MRRTVVEVERRVESAEIGAWRSPSIGFASPYGLVPFVKSREDVEVVLRRHDLLVEGQPVEFSGFSLHRSLRHAINLQLEIDNDDNLIPFRDLAAKQHIQVSWPADLLWFCHEKPVGTFRDFVADSLPLSEMSISPVDCDRIAGRLAAIALDNPHGYGFWRRVTRERFKQAGSLSRLLLEAAISAANRARAHSMSGIVPCLDVKTPGSLRLMDSYNWAFAHVVDDRLNDGLRTPAYLYTVALNSTVIRADDWHSMLDNILKRAELALESDLFEGAQLSLRGLDRISGNVGRVAVAKKLAQSLQRICNRHQMPFFWSRPAFVGLAGRDMGVSFASYRLNLSTGDVYPTFTGVTDRMRLFGRVVNPVRRVTWNQWQVHAAMRGPDGGMPDLGGITPTAPTMLQLESDRRYRVGFGKPYNIASFRYLDSLWASHVRSNDSHPGREYLQGFESPHNQWGLR